MKNVSQENSLRFFTRELLSFYDILQKSMPWKTLIFLLGRIKISIGYALNLERYTIIFNHVKHFQ